MGNSNSRRKLYKKREKQGLCIYCGKGSPKEHKKGCESCLEKKSEVTKKFVKNNKTVQQQYVLLVKHDVISKYGGKCACCGESEILFLTIDHIKNDGKKDRKKKKKYSTTSFYLELRRNPIRNDLQVLCWNCNLGKAQNGGICPHKKIIRKMLPKFDKRKIPILDRNTKIKWPTDKKLIQLCNKTNVNQVAKQLGVHNTTIRNRLKRRNKYHLINLKTKSKILCQTNTHG